VLWLGLGEVGGVGFKLLFLNQIKYMPSNFD
jgi:hypothetical protein